VKPAKYFIFITAIPVSGSSMSGFAARSPSSSSILRIPIDSDHSFRSNPIADSGVSDHLAGVGVS